MSASRPRTAGGTAGLRDLMEIVHRAARRQAGRTQDDVVAACGAIADAMAADPAADPTPIAGIAGATGSRADWASTARLLIGMIHVHGDDIAPYVALRTAAGVADLAAAVALDEPDRADEVACAVLTPGPIGIVDAPQYGPHAAGITAGLRRAMADTLPSDLVRDCIAASWDALRGGTMPGQAEATIAAAAWMLGAGLPPYGLDQVVDAVAVGCRANGRPDIFHDGYRSWRLTQGLMAAGVPMDDAMDAMAVAAVRDDDPNTSAVILSRLVALDAGGRPAVRAGIEVVARDPSGRHIAATGLGLDDIVAWIARHADAMDDGGRRLLATAAADAPSDVALRMLAATAAGPGPTGR